MPMTRTDLVEIRVPGDKSISHRALMLAALADGRSTVTGLLDSADTRSTASALRALGASIPEPSGSFAVAGRGLHGLRAAADALDCGNSGTTARLLMGVMAGYSFATRFDGDASLRMRPMRRVTGPLAGMGARIRELREPDRLPLEIAGGELHAIDFVNERASAQVKSAILLAALVGGTSARITERVHSRDHTERLFDAMGVDIRTVVVEEGVRIEIAATSSLKAIDIAVPGDFSSAAFFLARALLSGPAVRVRGVGVNATRTGFLDVIRRMHGLVHVTDRRESGGEPSADVSAETGVLHATQIEAVEIPHLVDEVPVLAVLAARAEGQTTFRGAGELRVKETDRLRALAENLRAVGANAEETSDGLVIEGSNAPLRGRVTTYGDHRIAMAFGILGSIPGNEIDMDDVACVSVSFPAFWTMLGECTR